MGPDPVSVQHQFFFLDLWSDGGARGNPGPAGIGFVIKDADGEQVYACGKYIGKTTNNVAEYMALIGALKQSHVLGAKKIRARLDSELVVKQLKGLYKVKNEGLRPLYLEAKKLLVGIQAEILHVRREDNSEADALVNEAIDSAVAGGPEEIICEDHLSRIYPGEQESLF